MTSCNITQSLLQVNHGCDGATSPQRKKLLMICLIGPKAEYKLQERLRIPNLTGIGVVFQVASSTPPLGFNDSTTAPSARMLANCEAKLHVCAQILIFNIPHMESCLLGVHDFELSWTNIVRGDRQRYSGNW